MFKSQARRLRQKGVSICTKANSSQEHKYYVFNAGKFITFLLDNKDTSTSVIEYGEGQYSLTKSFLFLSYQSPVNVKWVPVYDSLKTIFTSDSTITGTQIFIKVIKPAYAGPPSLIIQTEKKKIIRNFKTASDSVIVLLPAKETLKNIQLLCISFPPKDLPISIQFNKLEYTYYFRDHQPLLKLLPQQQLKYRIRKRSENAIFFSDKSRLLKTDAKEINYLRNLALKNKLLMQIMEFFNN